MKTPINLCVLCALCVSAVRLHPVRLLRNTRMQIDRLDLHGFTVADAMERFVRHYNWMVANRQGWALEVVHGKGTGRGDDAGVIRDTLRAFLKGQGKRIAGYDAQLLMRGAEYLLDNSGRLVYMHGE